MFAYCLNNPTNRIDLSGAASAWYYLIMHSDFGYIHRLVQAHILANYGSILRKELSLGGHGRADIVNTETGEVWEVKHASNMPEARAIVAANQAARYIGGEHDGIVVVKLGAAGAFDNYFYVTIAGENYRVDYTTPQAGAVIYSISDASNYTGDVYAVFSPKSNKEAGRNAAIYAGAAAALFLAGSGARAVYKAFGSSGPIPQYI